MGMMMRLMIKMMAFGIWDLIGFGNIFVVVLHFLTKLTSRITLIREIVFCIGLGCLILDVGQMTLFYNFLPEEMALVKSTYIDL